jgi:hypothetical protein
MTAPALPTASLAEFGPKRARGTARREKDGDITARVTAAPLPAAPAPAVAAAAEPPPRAEEIVVYWERLRRSRPLPPLAELDRALVAKGWPDSLVVIFDDDSAMPRISRLGATDGAVEYTPMVTDWILTRARQASRRGTKLDEVQNFPMVDGESPRYRLFLLPLGMSSGGGGGVLCHLCRVA